MTDFPSYPGNEGPIEALEQIAIVCTDNMSRDCDHRMALDFVRQVANDYLSRAPAQRQIEPTEAQVIEGAKALRRERGLFGEPTQSSITAARACLTAALSSTNCGGGK